MGCEVVGSCFVGDVEERVVDGNIYGSGCLVMWVERIRKEADGECERWRACFCVDLTAEFEREVEEAGECLRGCRHGLDEIF